MKSRVDLLGVPSYSDSAYKYNPLMQDLCGNPNARSIRPTQPYSRPLGYGMVEDIARVLRCH